MTTKTATAWELIRAADPMKGLDVTGASQAPAAQDLLRRITADDASSLTSGGSVDVATRLDLAPDRVLEPRRGRLPAALVAAAAVVLAVAAGATAWRYHQESPTRSPDRQTTAAGYSTALLAELPLPGDARRAEHAPIPEVAQSPFTGNGIIDVQFGWWTVPGTYAAAAGKFGRAALPAHWKNTATFTASGSSGPNRWVIEVRDPRASFVSSVTVVIAAHGQKVGMAAQIDTYAIPVRTPAQVIDASVDSATFMFTGGGGRSFSSKLTITVSGPRVTTLVRQVNSTPTYVLLTMIQCPPAGLKSVTVTFRKASLRWALNISPGSPLCTTPTLAGGSGPPIDLSPSTGLLTDVLTAGGLPSDYLDR